MFDGRLSKPIAIGVAAIAIASGAYGMVSATAGTHSIATTTSASLAPTSRQFAPGSVRPNARSGSAAGGAAGTVETVSRSSFTISTSAGQKVTVNKASSTTYRRGSLSTSADAIKNGKSVLVLGTVTGTTITAEQVIVEPTGGMAAPSATKVVPFQRGAPATAKQVGQIPANYTQGSGIIVSGTSANKATEAALASYPGGIVDRVVKVSDGEYEVHNIGVSWPHHIFVNQNFAVVGAD